MLLLDDTGLSGSTICPNWFTPLPQFSRSVVSHEMPEPWLESSRKPDGMLAQADPRNFLVRTCMRPFAGGRCRLATLARPCTRANLARRDTRCDTRPETGVCRSRRRGLRCQPADNDCI